MSSEALNSGPPGFVPPTLSGNGSLGRRLRDSRPARASSCVAAQLSAQLVCVTDCNLPLATLAASAHSSTGCDATFSSARAGVDDRPTPAVSQTAIVFTPDAVRLHDHPALVAAITAGHRFVVPVLVAHQAAYESHGGHCAWLAAATDLRRALRARGSDLVVVDGSGFCARDNASDSTVARAVLDVCHLLRAGAVYTHAGASGKHSAVQALCDDVGVDCVTQWNGTVLHPKELPFEICNMPDDCDAFACATERIKGKDPADVPTSFPPLPPDASRLIADLPSCPAASARLAHVGAPAASLFPCCESDALRAATSFFTSGSGVASARLSTRSKDDSVAAKACDCVRETRPLRSIDTTLGRLGKALAVGTLSARQLNYIMAESELTTSSPRCYCAKLELVQHDFTTFTALRRAISDTAARRHPPKSVPH